MLLFIYIQNLNEGELCCTLVLSPYIINSILFVVIVVMVNVFRLDKSETIGRKTWSGQQVPIVSLEVLHPDNCGDWTDSGWSMQTANMITIVQSQSK